MTPDAGEESPMSSHQAILEEKQASADFVVDVFPICQRIMAMGRVDIER